MQSDSPAIRQAYEKMCTAFSSSPRGERGPRSASYDELDTFVDVARDGGWVVERIIVAVKHAAAQGSWNVIPRLADSASQVTTGETSLAVTRTISRYYGVR
jgi:hypothetical protein